MTRQLRAYSDHADSVVWKVKYDKSNRIKKLDQEYHIQEDSLNFVEYENYKRDKHWFVWTAKEVKARENGKYEIYKYLPVGWSYHYDTTGHLKSVYLYENNKISDVYYLITYYPSGQLKDIFQYKKHVLHNIVEYYYPDGSPYEFGNFKNGNGQYIDLNILIGIFSFPIRSSGRTTIRNGIATGECDR